MSRPVYRRGKPHAERTAALLRLVANPALTARQDRCVQALVQSIRETLTERELECMNGYYVQKYNMAELGPKLGINPSTVCRNIQRGQGKLDRLVRLAEEISPLRSQCWADFDPNEVGDVW